MCIIFFIGIRVVKYAPVRTIYKSVKITSAINQLKGKAIWQTLNFGLMFLKL